MRTEMIRRTKELRILIFFFMDSIASFLYTDEFGIDTLQRNYIAIWGKTQQGCVRMLLMGKEMPMEGHSDRQQDESVQNRYNNGSEGT
jgi:hypothetical protein